MDEPWRACHVAVGRRVASRHMALLLYLADGVRYTPHQIYPVLCSQTSKIMCTQRAPPSAGPTARAASHHHAFSCSLCTRQRPIY